MPSNKLVYSPEEHNPERFRSGISRLFKGTWQELYDRENFANRILDAEIAMIGYSKNIYQLSDDLCRIWHSILWLLSESPKRSGDAEDVFFFQKLHDYFVEKFPVWVANWHDYGGICDYFHPYEFCSLGSIMGYSEEYLDELNEDLLRQMDTAA